MLSSWKLRVACYLSHPLVGVLVAKIYANRIPTFGGRLCVDPHLVSPETVATVFWRLFERSEVKLVSQYLRNDLDAIELGSGIGIVSLPAIRTQSPSKRLFCVEPNPRIVSMLKQSLQLNAPEKPVYVLNAAISYDSCQQVNLYVTDTHLGSHVVDQPSQKSVQVEAVKLETLITAHSILDYVLICDIEGAEIGIFLNDALSLNRCQQMIIELHDTSFGAQSFSVEDLHSLITHELGFSIEARRHNVFVYSKRLQW